MSYFFIALAAYLGLSLVAVIDKYILTGPIKSPVLYASTSGLLSLTALILWPWAKFNPTLSQIILDSSAGICFIIALVFYFLALKWGEASRVVPITGAFVPIFTLFGANAFLYEKLDSYQLIGVLLLIVGGVLISLKNKHHQLKVSHYKFFAATLIASLGFAAAFVITKVAYTTQPFLGVLILSSIGKGLIGLLLLGILLIKHEHHVKAAKPKARTLGLLVTARSLGAISGLGQNYAIAIASVTIINALQAFQYAFLFILIYLLGKKIPKLRENFKKGALIQKTIAILILAIGLVFVARPSTVKKTEYGITFSNIFAAHWLNQDWRKVYDDILSEFNLTWIRLPAYWHQIEPADDQWNFSDIDYQIEKASQKNIKIILAVGQKLPRWPECHIPDWAQKIENSKRQSEVLEYIETVLKRYDSNHNIAVWQVENEPLLPFGICPEIDYEFLKKEVSLVKSLTSKPMMITDSGEWSSWWKPSKLADIFGTTMYRQVYHDKFGIIYYPLPPAFFNVKAALAKLVSGKPKLAIMNVEMQGEPWGTKQINELTLEEQLHYMNPAQLQENNLYAKATGIAPIFWWGAEWWWWTKNVYNEPSVWNEAKKIINN